MQLHCVYLVAFGEDGSENEVVEIEGRYSSINIRMPSAKTWGIKCGAFQYGQVYR